MNICEQMDRELYSAAKDAMKPTHWLLSDEAWTQLRYESRNIQTIADPRLKGERKYKGVPIFIDNSVASPELRFDRVDDRHREDALLAMLDMMMQDYRERIRPIADELTAIRARRAPSRIFMVPPARPDLEADGGEK